MSRSYASDGHQLGRYNSLINDVLLPLFGDEKDGPAHAIEELSLFCLQDAIDPDVDNRWLLPTPRGACPHAERAVCTGTRNGIISARCSRKLFNRKSFFAAFAPLRATRLKARRVSKPIRGSTP